MKLHPNTNTVEMSGEIVEKEFTFLATAKAFAIMSSNLYSDKIAAPIRELCCNAYDAHVARGNPDVPFEVQLPTTLNPMFVVKDYGNGMSVDDMQNLYTTYFDSTKTDSEDQIGALGLGSKSPFAYTNNFTAESRHNGVKVVYTVFINASGKPALTCLIPPCETDEPSGMTISVPVRIADCSTFADRARRALMYFPVRPTVTGGPYGWDVYHLTHLLEGSNWKVRDAQYDAQMRGAYIIQGSVAYPLDVSQLGDDMSDMAIALAKTNLDMFVPLGDVEVAPSREALSYDPITVDNLIRHLEHATAEIRTSFQASIDQEPTLWAARRKTYVLRAKNGVGDLYTPLERHTPFTYKDVAISPVVQFPTGNFVTVAPVILAQTQKSSRGWRSSGVWRTVEDRVNLQVGLNTEVPMSERTHVYVDDVGVGRGAVYKTYQSQLFATHGNKATIVLIGRANPRVPLDNTELDTILAPFGAPDITPLSSIKVAVPARVAPTYAKRAKDERMKFIGFLDNDRPRNFSRLTWKRETVDFDLGGFYIPVFKFTPTDPAARHTSLDWMLSAVQRSGLMSSDEVDRTYAFSDKDMDAIAGDEGWVNLYDYVRSELRARIESGDLIYHWAYKADAQNMYGHQSFIRWVHKHKDSFVNGPFGDFWIPVSESVHGTINRHADDILELVRILGMTDITAQVEAEGDIISKNRLSLDKRYPMLNMINLEQAISSTNMMHFIDYINGIDASYQPPLLEAA